MFGNPMEIAILVGAAVLLFGADQAKKEFMVGQAEADVAAERARAEARASAEAQAVKTPTVTEPQAANGIVVGSTTTPFEPPAPHN